MKKSKLLLLSLLASCGALGVIGGTAFNNANRFSDLEVAGEEMAFSVDMFNAIKENIAKKTATALTALGTPITVSFNGVSASGDKLILAKDGFIKNDTAITGLSKINTDFTGDISYWNADEQMVVHNKADAGVLDFDSQLTASFFKLTADKEMELSSLKAFFTCSAENDKGSIQASYNPSKIVWDQTNKAFNSSGASATTLINVTADSGHVRYKQNRNSKTGSSVGFCINLSYTGSYFWESSTGATYHDIVLLSSGKVSLAKINPSFAWEYEKGATIPSYSTTSTYTVDVYFNNQEGRVVVLVDNVLYSTYVIPEAERYAGNKLGFRLNDGVVISEVEVWKNKEYVYESNFNTSATEQAIPSEWKAVAYGTGETGSACSNGELVFGNKASGNKNLMLTGKQNPKSMFVELDARLALATTDNASIGLVFSASSYNATSGASSQTCYIQLRKSGTLLKDHYFSKIGKDYAGSEYVGGGAEGTSKEVYTSMSIKTSFADIYNALGAGEKVHIVASVIGREVRFFINNLLITTYTLNDGIDNYRGFGLFSIGNYGRPAYSNIKITNI